MKHAKHAILWSTQARKHAKFIDHASTQVRKARQVCKHVKHVRTPST